MFSEMLFFYQKKPDIFLRLFSNWVENCFQTRTYCVIIIWIIFSFIMLVLHGISLDYIQSHCIGNLNAKNISRLTLSIGRCTKLLWEKTVLYIPSNSSLWQFNIRFVTICTLCYIFHIKCIALREYISSLSKGCITFFYMCLILSYE